MHKLKKVDFNDLIENTLIKIKNAQQIKTEKNMQNTKFSAINQIIV
jgi:hypothetical protein